MQETDIVIVTYPDGKGNHETTVAELRKKWKQETKEWQKNFFTQLMHEGKAHSNYGEYLLAGHETNKH